MLEVLEEISKGLIKDEMLEKQIIESRTVLKQRFFNQLVSGTINELNEIKEKIESLKEKIERVLKSDGENSAFSGIGISNVNERIKLNFGEEYGLNIESMEGLYTSVEVRLPIIEEKKINAEGSYS